jgi:hypothetical protein
LPDASPPAASAAVDEAPRPARARDGAFVESDAADPDAADPDAADPDAADPEPAASAALDPDDPAEPVVSANATGDATADPTPKATANAPTRPTYAA